MKNWWMIITLIIIIGLLIGFRKPIKKAMTRGYINKNPGNIRLTDSLWKGEVKGTDKDFKTFKSMAWGYRAMFVLMRTYIQYKQLNTVRKIINVYAPPVENLTESYIKSVTTQTGLQPDEQINFSDENTIVNLVAAISYHENGIKPDLSEINSGLNLFKAG